ncbi:MAG TPA: hypothetical protein VGN17_26200 [Bryobacteraceae bacterium]
MTPQKRSWTQEQVDGYVGSRNQCCPFCKSEELETEESVDACFGPDDGNHYWRTEMRCQNCNAQWEDVYQLVGIAPLEEWPAPAEGTHEKDRRQE